MTQWFLPRVFEPQTIADFARAYYKANYKGDKDSGVYVNSVLENLDAYICAADMNQKGYLVDYVAQGVSLADSFDEADRLCRAKKHDLVEIRGKMGATAKSEALDALRNIELEEKKKIRKFNSDAKDVQQIIIMTSPVITCTHYCPEEYSGIVAVCVNVGAFVGRKAACNINKKVVEHVAKKRLEELNGDYVRKLKDIDADYTYSLSRIDEEMENENSRNIGKSVSRLKTYWSVSKESEADQFVVLVSSSYKYPENN
jgi:hypothetical protein